MKNEMENSSNFNSTRSRLDLTNKIDMGPSLAKGDDKPKPSEPQCQAGDFSTPVGNGRVGVSGSLDPVVEGSIHYCRPISCC